MKIIKKLTLIAMLIYAFTPSLNLQAMHSNHEEDTATCLHRNHFQPATQNIAQNALEMAQELGQQDWLLEDLLQLIDQLSLDSAHVEKQVIQLIADYAFPYSKTAGYDLYQRALDEVIRRKACRTISPYATSTVLADYPDNMISHGVSPATIAMCPQCTFFNPIVNRSCEMCKSLLLFSISPLSPLAQADQSFHPLSALSSNSDNSVALAALSDNLDSSAAAAQDSLAAATEKSSPTRRVASAPSTYAAEIAPCPECTFINAPEACWCELCEAVLI